MRRGKGTGGLNVVGGAGGFCLGLMGGGRTDPEKDRICPPDAPGVLGPIMVLIGPSWAGGRKRKKNVKPLFSSWSALCCEPSHIPLGQSIHK